MEHHLKEDGCERCAAIIASVQGREEKGSWIANQVSGLRDFIFAAPGHQWRPVAALALLLVMAIGNVWMLTLWRRSNDLAQQVALLRADRGPDGSAVSRNLRIPSDSRGEDETAIIFAVSATDTFFNLILELGPRDETEVGELRFELVDANSVIWSQRATASVIGPWTAAIGVIPAATVKIGHEYVLKWSPVDSAGSIPAGERRVKFSQR
jgi:hypothetical protein